MEKVRKIPIILLLYRKMWWKSHEFTCFIAIWSNLRPKWRGYPHICKFVWISCNLSLFYACFGHNYAIYVRFTSKMSTLSPYLGKMWVKTPYCPPYMQIHAKNGLKTCKKQLFWPYFGCFWHNFSNILQFYPNILQFYPNILQFLCDLCNFDSILCDLLTFCYNFIEFCMICVQLAPTLSIFANPITKGANLCLFVSLLFCFDKFVE